MSLLARLYVLVALAVLPAIVILGASELALRRDREAQMHEEALRLAEFAASEVNGLLEGARTLLVTLAHAPAITKRDPGACGRLLGAIGHDLAKYRGLGVVGLDGKWICSQNGLPPGGIDSKGRPWFEHAVASDHFLVGNFTLGRRSGVPVLPITMPFRDPSGRVAGLVGLGLDLDWLDRRLAARSMPATASFSIVDRGGTLLVRLPDRDRVGEAVRDQFRWMLDAPSPATVSDRAPDGTRRIIGFVPPAAMLDGAVLVSVGLPTDVALEPFAAATRRGLTLMALAMLLAIVAARLGGNAFILKPLRALFQAAERWRGGDYGARVGLGVRHGEFGRLGQAFDSMAGALAAQEREIGHTMAALRDSEARFRQFADSSHDVLWMFDRRRGRIEFLSHAFAEVWGRPPEELIEARVDFAAMVHPDDRPLIGRAFDESLAGRSASISYRVVRPDGSLRWVRDSGFAIRDAAGEVVALGGISRDITEMKAIEDERERVLHEREAMLRELNHRVKNNLQVIISLLRLQAEESASVEVREAFGEACGRVSTITELHVALFAGTEVGSLDFGAYLQDLCSRLESTARGADDGQVRIVVDAGPGVIDLDRAIPLGLVVNELVSNAIRHAFPDGRDGTIRVGFARAGDSFHLSVHDNGAGPAGGVAALQGLGLQLVNGFVRRIRGSLTLAAGEGVAAVVEFPADPQPRTPKAAGDRPSR